MKTKRTTLFLMANLGSEMARLFALQKGGEIDLARKSADRAIIIINKLLARPEIGAGKKEIEILKTLTEDMLLPSPYYMVNEEEISSYFMPFAVRLLR
ncbi:MAG: hypothetical protein Q7S34_01970 [bacterium]|nr:hypothetical protein [bacterium]